MNSKCCDPITIPGGDSGKIHFVLSAKDLPRRNRGALGTTIQDPFVKWYQRHSKRREFREAGITKHRDNEINPEWYDQVFSYEWIRGTGQLWRFEMMDQDSLSKNDNMGFVEVDVDDYVLNNREDLSTNLSNGGKLLIKKCVPQRFRLSARSLPKLDPLNGLSDPYVQCYWSVGEDGPQTLFATTKTIKNVEEAEWDEVFEFGNYQVGNKQFWTFKVFDKDPLPKDDFIGEASIDVDKYIKSRNAASLKLSKDATNEAVLIITPA